MPPPTLIALSGLPGTGKTTLALALRERMHLPLLAIDDVVDAIPAHMAPPDSSYWEDMIAVLLHLVESQLRYGNSVILDHVFMGTDRAQGRVMCEQTGARWKPVHVFISDVAEWENRVRMRHAENPAAATWERILRQRLDFWPWEPGTALLLDSMRPLNENVAKVLEHIARE